MKNLDFKKILEKFKINDKELFYKDLLKMLSIVVLIFIIVNISIYLFVNSKIKTSFENSTISKATINDTSIFNIEKIVMFSSGYATTNSTNLDIWNLDISQFTDIAIYINNNIDAGLTDKNIIKNLYINNIEFKPAPILGTTNINYKNINNFGKYTDIETSSSLDFDIINYNNEINFEDPQLYNSLQNPITLGYVNKNIKTEYPIVNNNEILNFDGSLLSKSKISLDDISTNILFDIKITNNLNQEFICSVSIPVLLEDDNSNIYSGNIYKTFEFNNQYNFYRIK